MSSVRRSGLVAGGMLTAVVLILIVGVFAMPAVIGAFLIGGIARKLGATPERATGLSVGGFAVLLLIGMVTAYALVPTTQVEFGRPELLGNGDRDRILVFSTPDQAP